MFRDYAIVAAIFLAALGFKSGAFIAQKMTQNLRQTVQHFLRQKLHCKTPLSTH